MKHIVIRSSSLDRDAEDYVVATTIRDLDLIAYVCLCNELQEYLLDYEPPAPAPPDVFESLPEYFRNTGRRDWELYQRRILGIKQGRERFREALKKIEARDPSGCWDLLPKHWVYQSESMDPLEFLDVEYHPRTLDPME